MSEAYADKELIVSLSGNLGFVSLDEVLRLLTRSDQQGCVSVSGDGVSGRVFVVKGGISLATTNEDEGLRTLLVKSGLVDSTEVGAESPIPKDNTDLVELLREVTVESIYRLGMQGATFEVYEGRDSRYASPRPFELEHLLDDAKRRLNDWAEVSKIVSDLETRVRFQRDLGDRDEVTIKREAWRVLSEVRDGSSVSQIAGELGTTEFWTARIVARLMEEDLLDTEKPATAPQATSWDTPLEDAVSTLEQQSHGDESEDESQTTADVAEAEADTEAVAEARTAMDEDAEDEEVNPNESWWEEPEDEAGADGEGDVEEDTEAFLEKVFSELETPEEPEDEGYGLLRRRRLGAMRDLGNDS